MTASAQLTIGGIGYDAWTEVRVTKSLESLADTFDFRFQSPWRKQPEAWPIAEGDPCVVSLDGDEVISGHLDDWEAVGDAQTIRMRAAGRSRTGDLVDSAPIHKPGHWKSATMMQVITDICEPFDITPFLLDGEADAEKAFARVAIEEGETCQGLIERLTRARGYMAVAEGDHLALVRAGRQEMSEPLARPGNIMSGGRFGSWRDRFDRYLFRGQTKATDDWNGKGPAQLKDEVSDPFVTRYRPMRVLSDTQGDRGDLGRAALRERNTRAGRSERLTYAVHGWRNGNGQLWTTNARVAVNDTLARVNGVYLITQVTYSYSGQGEIAELTLARPEAFDIAREVAA